MYCNKAEERDPQRIQGLRKDVLFNGRGASVFKGAGGGYNLYLVGRGKTEEQG